MPRFMASDTSRCWAPSCRSRSIRLRSVSAASTTPARLSDRVSTLRSSSSDRFGPSSARAARRSSQLTPVAANGATSSRRAPATVSAISGLGDWNCCGVANAYR